MTESERLDTIERLLPSLLVGRNIYIRHNETKWLVEAVSKTAWDNMECSRINKGQVIRETINLHQIWRIV